MTVVVAFNCRDGVVIAADSMLTPSMGNLSVGHHHGMKIAILAGPQLFAFAGDQGQAMRFKVMADGSSANVGLVDHELDYVISLSASIIQQFQNTGIGNSINLNTILAFERHGRHHCCVFEGVLQPRFLDADHHYVALGSGKLSADPFLRFVTDVFCADGNQPTVREAIFMATWTVQHVIDTNPGGVAGPIRVAVFEPQRGNSNARSLPAEEIEEHRQAVESAANALRNWRDQMLSGHAADGAPPQPTSPPPPT